MAEISKLNNYDIKDKKAIRYYNTVADMKADTTLKSGMYAQTKGYYSINDGGGAYYHITDTESDTFYQETLNNDLYANLIPQENTIYSKQFGCKGDGITDDSEKLNIFFSYPSYNYIVNDGIYLVDSNINKFTDNSYIKFENATIKRKATNLEVYYIFDIYKRNNIILDNINIVGDKDEHTGATGEYGHCVHITESQNITLKNSTIEKAWGDGLYIGYKYYVSPEITTENIVVENCKFLNNSRHGIAICSGNHITIDNCYMYNNKRISPKVGIGVEPEHSDDTVRHLNDLKITNCISDNNYSGFGFSAMKNCTDIYVENCTAINNEYGYLVRGFTNSSDFRMFNCKDVNSENYSCNFENIDSTSYAFIDDFTVIGGKKLTTENVYQNSGILITVTDYDCYNVSINNLIVKKVNGYGKRQVINFNPNSQNSTNYKAYNLSINNITMDSGMYVYLQSVIDYVTCSLKNVNLTDSFNSQSNTVGGNSPFFTKIFSKNIENVNKTLKFRVVPTGFYEWVILQSTNGRTASVDLSDFTNVYFNGSSQSSKIFDIDTTFKSSVFKFYVENKIENSNQVSYAYVYDDLSSWTPRSV